MSKRNVEVSEEESASRETKRRKTDHNSHLTEFTHNDYTVGWICALPKEQTAATAMLDQRHANLPTSIVRGEHDRRRREFADRGASTIRDGYVASQIPDLNRQVWSEGLGCGLVEQSLRTQLDFLLGNSMLLRQSNRLPIELADLFLMPLPKEGTRGDSWCFVVVMDQGKHPAFYPFNNIPTYTIEGKTNQHGRLEYGAALRHRDYRSCVIGALAA
jgi:hypothetical protein